MPRQHCCRSAGPAPQHRRQHLDPSCTRSTSPTPIEQDDNNLPEPYGRIWLQSPWIQQTALWEHPDVDINTPTLPRYPDDGPYTVRYVDHPVTELCANVGEDDTGINRDDVLADGCVPVHGPGHYTISGPDGSVTVHLLDV